MGRFGDNRNRNRGGFGRDRGGFGGGRGGYGRGRDRDRDSERRPLEMHDAICDKCGKECRVPFKPTQGKPVLCSDCFRESGRDRSVGRNDFGSRNQSSQSGGVSLAQLNQINMKLDKIIKALELDSDEDEDEEEDDTEEEN